MQEQSKLPENIYTPCCPVGEFLRNIGEVQKDNFSINTCACECKLADGEVLSRLSKHLCKMEKLFFTCMLFVILALNEVSPLPTHLLQYQLQQMSSLFVDSQIIMSQIALLHNALI